MLSTKTQCAIASFVIAGAAHADDPPVGLEILAKTGDAIPGIGSILEFQGVVINDSGIVVARVETDHPNPGANTIALEIGGPVLVQEGQILGPPLFATIAGIGDFALDDTGHRAFCHLLGGVQIPPLAGALFADDTLLLAWGDAAHGPTLPLGTTYRTFLAVKRNNERRLAALAWLSDPNQPDVIESAITLCELDAAGHLAKATVVAHGSQPVAGTPYQIHFLGTSPASFDFNDAGQVLYSTALSMGGSAATPVSSAVILGTEPIALQDQPSPVPGRTWRDLNVARVSLNDRGDALYSGELDGETTSNLLIVKNGMKFVQEGDVLGDFAPFHLEEAFFGASPVVDDRRQVIWRADWSDADGTRDSGLFVAKKRLLQEGVTTVDGQAIDEIAGLDGDLAVSSDGRYIVVRVLLENGQQALVRLDLGPWEDLDGGSPSTGAAPFLLGLGLPVPNAPVCVVLDGAPAHSIALLVVGTTTARIPLAGGTLIPSPEIVVRLPVDGFGRAEVAARFPPNVPAGMLLNAQFIVVDPTTVGGHRLSNAVRLTVH